MKMYNLKMTIATVVLNILFAGQIEKQGWLFSRMTRAFHFRGYDAAMEVYLSEPCCVIRADDGCPKMAGIKM